MIFALGFVIGLGIFLCIPGVWEMLTTYFGRSKIYSSDEPEDERECRLCNLKQDEINYLKAQKKELVDNNQKLGDQILELESENSRAENTIHELENRPAATLDVEKIKDTAFGHLVDLVSEYFYYDRSTTECQRNESFRNKIKKSREFVEKHWNSK